jgi:hypothetical protein
MNTAGLTNCLYYIYGLRPILETLDTLPLALSCSATSGRSSAKNKCLLAHCPVCSKALDPPRITWAHLQKSTYCEAANAQSLKPRKQNGCFPCEILLQIPPPSPTSILDLSTAYQEVVPLKVDTMILSPALCA